MEDHETLPGQAVDHALDHLEACSLEFQFRLRLGHRMKRLDRDGVVSGSVLHQGDPAVFSIAATGEEPFEYQWQFNEEDIDAATGQRLEFNDAQPANDGSYRVLVGNRGGVVTSQAAALIVHTPPVITAHPANQDIKVGDALSLNVEVAGTGTIQYQWQYNQNDLGDQNSKELIIETVQLTHAGQYRVIATTQGGTVVSESSVVTVDASTPVDSEAPVITRQPLSQTLAVG